MEEEEYTGLNPWHEAVCTGRGLFCRRCQFYYQGEEQWRLDPTATEWWCTVSSTSRFSPCWNIWS
jgi:hypothetical protein